MKREPLQFYPAKVSPSDRAPSGFTLIELLTVIAIIAILAAILIPVLGSVRERAHAATCRSNLRQCGIALLTLANDHHGTVLVHRSGPNSQQQVWNDRLIFEGYVDAGDRSVFFCPTQPPLDGHLDRTEASPHATYGFNMFGPAGRSYSPADGGSPLYRFDLNHVEDLSHYFLLADSLLASTGLQRMRISDARARPTVDGVHARHSELAHMVFSDGHVEAVDRDRMRGIGLISYFGPEGNILPVYD